MIHLPVHSYWKNRCVSHQCRKPNSNGYEKHFTGDKIYVTQFVRQPHNLENLKVKHVTL